MGGRGRPSVSSQLRQLEDDLPDPEGRNAQRLRENLRNRREQACPKPAASTTPTAFHTGTNPLGSGDASTRSGVQPNTAVGDHIRSAVEDFLPFLSAVALPSREAG